MILMICATGAHRQGRLILGFWLCMAKVEFLGYSKRGDGCPEFWRVFSYCDRTCLLVVIVVYIKYALESVMCDSQIQYFKGKSWRSASR